MSGGKLAFSVPDKNYLVDVESSRIYLGRRRFFCCAPSLDLHICHPVSVRPDRTAPRGPHLPGSPRLWPPGGRRCPGAAGPSLCPVPTSGPRRGQTCRQTLVLCLNENRVHEQKITRGGANLVKRDTS